MRNGFRRRSGTRRQFDILEPRLVLSVQPAGFAQFVNVPIAPESPAEIAVHVRAEDFAMPRGRVLLGFAAYANHGELDLDAPSIRGPRTGSAKTIGRRADVDELSSFTLVRMRPGDFTVRITSEQRAAGNSTLDVSLVGDANADRRVDRRDIDLIRSHVGARAGEPGYGPQADVDRDGVVDRRDVFLAWLNLGASTTLQAPALLVNISPDSDPDGNGIVVGSTVELVGQTQPGAMVRIHAGSGTPVRDSAAPSRSTATPATVVADPHGHFRLEADAAHGHSLIRVEARNGFGQFVTAELPVRYGDAILNWNASLLNVIRDWTTLSNDPYPNRIVPERPPVAARNLAMVHTAMFDAVNAFEQTYEPYHATLLPPAGASPVAAAAAAAHRVASHLYQAADERAVFDAALAESLRTLSDGDAKSSGVEFGRRVGDAILTLRANDGAAAPESYRAGTEPGDWNRTFPDFLPPLLPHWPNLKPFAMTSGNQFRVAAPPALDSVEYAAAVNEVKELGRLRSSVRSAEQTEIALFWADGGGTFTPPGHWNQIATDVALERNTTLAENARLFALLNIALADAGIASWDAKYAYNFWRPIDAIRRAAEDSNDATQAEAQWMPLLKTPPFPAYTSGHSTFSGAADAVLSSFFGPDVAFTSRSDGHTGFSQRPLPVQAIATRSFSSFRQAADEAGQSRIYGGIHFQFDNQAGLEAGRALGQFVVDNLLKPS